MSDIHVRKEGRAGRITLTRPKALNAVTYDMCLAIEVALDAWRDDDDVTLVILDAEGDKAFSAGGDIADLYATGKAGDFGFGQTFWRDEYRMNAKIHEYAKPIVSFLQGFTMGGGMGVGCHGSHRIVGESSQIAMPEVGIGLVPDVGGSMILANAPGHLGAYAGTTGARMNAGDAIEIGFADMFISQANWPEMIAKLVETGNIKILRAEPAPNGVIHADKAEIDQLFDVTTLPDLLSNLRRSDSEFSQKTLKTILRNSPLSVGFTLEMLARLKGVTDIRTALDLEYRFTFRAMEHGDFIEGIRAAIIDKDRSPNWKHDADSLPQQAIDTMLAPLGDNALTF
ncbi:enoyl-CoA hydratase/isomerase family protein [Aliiroseovarius subalbicans]|uniref:enoyl-CoA hydratase/isomerase family protein n=1 Tax=Aliiroseovarius subalbicans TaxID=2925840 RepID=UPI001F58B1CA|nr:enoyl-CoA hydratase/isomerase family protein [Aliiroseovarius subalbicans]MCI2398821.1 enoyl-CoA hydratase/isomerase family protein [Aliiroseovarius subalbicans]